MWRPDKKLQRWLWTLGTVLFLSLCGGIWWYHHPPEPDGEAEWARAVELWEETHGTIEYDCLEGEPPADENIFREPEIESFIAAPAYGRLAEAEGNPELLLVEHFGHGGPFPRDAYREVLQAYASEWELIEHFERAVKSRPEAWRPGIHGFEEVNPPYLTYSARPFIELFRLILMRAKIDARLGDREACLMRLELAAVYLRKRGRRAASIIDVIIQESNHRSFTRTLIELADQRPEWADSFLKLMELRRVNLQVTAVQALRWEMLRILSYVDDPEQRHYLSASRNGLRGKIQREFEVAEFELEIPPFSQNEMYYYFGLLAQVLNREFFFPDGVENVDNLDRLTETRKVYESRCGTRGLGLSYGVIPDPSGVLSDELVAWLNGSELALHLIARRNRGLKLPATPDEAAAEFSLDLDGVQYRLLDERIFEIGVDGVKKRVYPVE